MIVWLLAMNVVVFGRLLTFRSDDTTGGYRLLAAAVGQTGCLLLFVSFDMPGGILLIVTLVAGVVPFLSEQSKKWHVHWRLFVLVAYGTLIAFPLVGGRPQLSVERIGWVEDVLRKSLFWRFAERMNTEYTLAMGLGLLLCLEEANMFLRVVLKALDVSPPAPSDEAPPDPGVYLKGGLVGSIERLLIFVFVMHDAYNAISFVIAAKTIARFTELTKNASAYILIGTLLSTLAAIALGLAALQFKTGA